MYLPLQVVCACCTVSIAISFAVSPKALSSSNPTKWQYPRNRSQFQHKNHENVSVKQLNFDIRTLIVAISSLSLGEILFAGIQYSLCTRLVLHTPPHTRPSIQSIPYPSLNRNQHLQDWLLHLSPSLLFPPLLQIIQLCTHNRSRISYSALPSTPLPKINRHLCACRYANRLRADLCRLGGPSCSPKVG